MCEVQGEILINGTDTSTLSLRELRDSISVIPQVCKTAVVIRIFLFYTIGDTRHATIALLMNSS